MSVVEYIVSVRLHIGSRQQVLSLPLYLYTMLGELPWSEVQEVSLVYTGLHSGMTAIS